MQHQKYVEPRKKWDDGYDFKIFMVINAHRTHLFMVINAHKKHPYVFLSIIYWEHKL